MPGLPFQFRQEAFNLFKSYSHWMFSIPVLFFMVVLCSPVHRLTITDGEGRTAGRFDLRSGEEFTVRYVHSVQKTPVLEVFRIDFRQGIELRETLYRDFGAGLPFLLEGRAVMETAGGWVRIYGINRHMPGIAYRVARFADFCLLIRGKEIPFTDFEKPGRPLHFTGERLPFLLSFF